MLCFIWIGCTKILINRCHHLFVESPHLSGWSKLLVGEPLPSLTKEMADVCCGWGGAREAQRQWGCPLLLGSPGWKVPRACDMVRSFSSVHFSHSVVSDSATSWTAAHQASLSITNSWSLLKLMSIESVMPSNNLILCRPLLPQPSIFPSIRVFSNESVLCMRWPKYWSFSFNISPSNEHPGLISFRVDWFDLLAVTLKSLLQHHSSKASIRRGSALFTVQLSHPYMTTGKTMPWLDGPLLAK